MKEQIINNILRVMSIKMNKQQLDMLEVTLIRELENYSIIKTKNELIEYDPRYDFENLVIQFQATMALRGLSERTIEQYVNATKQCMLHINKPISEITTLDIKNYLAYYVSVPRKNALSKATLNNLIRYINSFYSWLEFEEIIDKNPMRKIKSVKLDKQIKQAFKDAEVEEMRCNASCERDLALIDVLLSTGARASEVHKMNIYDIKDNSLIVHGKGSKDRIVYLSEAAMVHLNNYLKSRKDKEAALFVSKKAPYNRLNSRSIYSIVSKIGMVSDVHAYPHKFRRTMATKASYRGMPIQEIAHLMGHSQITTTEIYCNVNENNVKLHHSQYCC